MANWIWYPGDFELYHSLCQNFDREERGFFWPANWKAAQYHHCVRFSCEYELEQETEVRITVLGRGYVNVRRQADPPPWIPAERLKDGIFYAEEKHPVGTITCPAGKGGLDIIVCDVSGLPCALAEGEVIQSGAGWWASDQVEPPKKAGWNEMYTQSSQNPRIFAYTSEVREPVQIEEVNGGLLYDFGRELTAETLIAYPKGIGRLTLCYGESRKEALDVELCYLKQSLDLESETAEDEFGGRREYAPETGTERENPALGSYRTKLRAFRYLFLPEKEAARRCHIQADYKYVDFPVRAGFTSSDERLNEIWRVADITFRLASGIFFLDGVKRDRYIWSGDAYQSYFINQYLFFDEEICKRTMIALRGTDPIVQHINGILDYSMYWLMGMEQFYQMTGDREFLEMIYPKMKSMMDYLERQTDEHGFLYGRPGDWVFIDWADIDKEGPISAEQFLLARSYQTMAKVEEVLGVSHTREEEPDKPDYAQKQKYLLEQIRTFYWDNEQGAFIDSFVSGKRKVSRHPNIFAVLFDYAEEAETESILTHVLLNDAVTAITTPYFKFYELEALAKLGRLAPVLDSIKSYWGGMLDRGADTFWEEFRPEDPEDKQYGMYGDPYGKSLCHAWGASPIYLLGRYVCGLRPTAPGYESWEIVPDLSVIGGKAAWGEADVRDKVAARDEADADGTKAELPEALTELHVTLPLKGGSVWLDYQDGTLSVKTDKAGGTLVAAGVRHILVPGEIFRIDAQ